MLEENSTSKVLLYILTIVLFIFSVKFFITKQISIVLYIIFIYITYIILLYFEGRKKYKIKSYVKTFIVITIILDIVFGFYFNLYHTSNWFDKAMHMFGCFSFTLLFISIIHSNIKRFSHSKIIIFILITSLGITSGVFYEFIEFGWDIISKSKTQKGLLDTNLDLIFDTFGAMAAASLILYRKVSIYR